MKKITFISVGILLTLLSHLHAQTHSLVKKWETDSIFKTPESVLYDAKSQILYVSNMDPASGDKGGHGSIAKVGLDGKVITMNWVSGLTSPKGMGIYKNLLYVAELTDVAIIDIDKAQIVKRVPVEGAVFLNDITISKNGAVYVSDSRTLKVHRIEKGFVATLLQNLKGPNGLLAVGNDLLVLDKGSLIKMLDNGQLTTISEGMDPSTDGIEMVKPNEYLVSSWSGIVYYISANGEKETLLDTRVQKMNTADIGYDKKNRVVYVPTFYRNKIVAYELK